jgi:hypothetical protein
LPGAVDLDDENSPFVAALRLAVADQDIAIAGRRDVGEAVITTATKGPLILDRAPGVGPQREPVNSARTYSGRKAREYAATVLRGNH